MGNESHTRRKSTKELLKEYDDLIKKCREYRDAFEVFSPYEQSEFNQLRKKLHHAVDALLDVGTELNKLTKDT